MCSSLLLGHMSTEICQPPRELNVCWWLHLVIWMKCMCAFQVISRKKASYFHPGTKSRWVIFNQEEVNNIIYQTEVSKLWPVDQIWLVAWFSCSPWVKNGFELLNCCKKKEREGTSLVVQWLRLDDPNARGQGSILGHRTRPHKLQPLTQPNR